MALVRKLVGSVAILMLLLLALVGGYLAGRSGIGSVVEPASLSEAERRFSERMKGASLIGQFTVTGREDRPANPERYDISSVEKVGDDLWRFNARIRYGSVDSTLPIVVPMRFTGDTPMISMTDLAIPGMGSFTVRVVFYGDQYAGTWLAVGKVGGHMFGKIERGGE